MASLSPVNMKGPSSVRKPSNDEQPGPPFIHTATGSLVGLRVDVTNPATTQQSGDRRQRSAVRRRRRERERRGGGRGSVLAVLCDSSEGTQSWHRRRGGDRCTAWKEFCHSLRRGERGRGNRRGGQ